MDTGTIEDQELFATGAADGPTDAELREIEAELTASDGDEVAALRALLAERDTKEREHLARYRRALVAANPLLTEEMLAGETFDEVEASYNAARQLADRLRAETGAVPAGAPGRSAGVPATSLDKIRRGLSALT